jgi:hypothetical protein
MPLAGKMTSSGKDYARKGLPGSITAQNEQEARRMGRSGNADPRKNDANYMSGQRHREYPGNTIPIKTSQSAPAKTPKRHKKPRDMTPAELKEYERRRPLLEDDGAVPKKGPRCAVM